MKSIYRPLVGIKLKDAIFDSLDLYTKEDVFMLGALSKDMEYYARLRDTKKHGSLNPIEQSEWDTFYSGLRKTYTELLFEAVCITLDADVI